MGSGVLRFGLLPSRGVPRPRQQGVTIILMQPTLEVGVILSFVLSVAQVLILWMYALTRERPLPGSVGTSPELLAREWLPAAGSHPTKSAVFPLRQWGEVLRSWQLRFLPCVRTVQTLGLDKDGIASRWNNRPHNAGAGRMLVGLQRRRA